MLDAESEILKESSCGWLSDVIVKGDRVMPIAKCTGCGRSQEWSNKRGVRVKDILCSECGAPLRGLNKEEHAEVRRQRQEYWDDFYRKQRLKHSLLTMQSEEE